MTVATASGILVFMSNFSERVANINAQKDAAAAHETEAQNSRAEVDRALDIRLATAAKIAGQIATQLSQKEAPSTQTITIIGEVTRNWRRQLISQKESIQGWRGNSQFDGPIPIADRSGWATMVTEDRRVLYLSKNAWSDTTITTFPEEYTCSPEALGPVSTIDAARGIAGLRQYSTPYEQEYPLYIDRIEDGLANLAATHSLHIVE